MHATDLVAAAPGQQQKPHQIDIDRRVLPQLVERRPQIANFRIIEDALAREIARLTCRSCSAQDQGSGA
jgi:hypothetical protein